MDTIKRLYMAVELVKTDIAGLDEMLNGGIPQGHSILLAGGPGTGKTSTAVEFLYRGALKGEKGVMISLEEDEASILRNVSAVFTKWDKFENLIKKKNINIIKTTKNDMPSIINLIRTYVVKPKAARLVIDSGTLLKLFYKAEIEFRKALFSLINELKKSNCTTLITDELESAERSAIRFDVEQFLVDGIINLYNMEMKNKRVNAVEVLKMRAANHKKTVVPLKITDSGIKIFPTESIF